MSSESPKAPKPFHDKPASTLHSENIEHIAYSDEETTSDENDRVWFPGDGICPSTSQFSEICQTSYNIWTSAASKFTQNSVSDPFRLDLFFDLLQDVPPFFHNPPENIDLRGRSNSQLILRSSLHLGTTEGSSCDQAWKTIEYLQFLGFPKPVTFRQTETPSSVFLRSGRSGYLTSIILAWSYILSSRWVEILRLAGKKSSLTHIQGKHLSTDFWTLVIKSHWATQVENDTETFYAPWMLRKENYDVGKRYIQLQLPSYRVKLLKQ